MGERSGQVGGLTPFDEGGEAVQPVQPEGIASGGPGMEGWAGGVREDITPGGAMDQDQPETDEERGEGPLASAPSDDEKIAAARADIEQTRAEMSETIDAIEEKLSPERLKEQATEGVKRATVGKAKQALGTARRKATEAAGGASGTARGAGSAASRRVKQRPIPVVAAGLSLAGLALGAWMTQVRRKREEQAAQARQIVSAGGALNRAQRTMGQVVRQTQGAATRIATRSRDRASQESGTGGARGRLPLRWRGRLSLNTPLAVSELVAALGLVIAFVILRRRRSSSGPAPSPLQSETRPWATWAQDATSRMVKQPFLIIAIAVPVGLLAARRFRRSTGKERTMTRADLMMAWLNNAYSMEMGLVHTLQSHARDAEDFPQLQARIQQHVEETRRHADLVRGCIERRGGSTSALKRGMATVAGKAQGVATRPAQDRVVKNALADSSAEQLEIASYMALIAAAQDLGDQDTVAACRQILRDEEEMARFLDQNLPTVVTETMRRIPAATS
ncbi:MAG: DUF892 family protein [Chloroflexi bacterium]|nr:DUF892 family protein [Chloroflexota bacterium]